MKKNVASQVIGAQMVSATDGSAFTSAVTVYVTGNGGAQAVGSVGSGACTHEGNGFHTYAPAQAETNYDHVAFTFIGTGAVPATVQVFPSFPQTGDSFALIGSTGSGLTSLATQASVNTVDTVVDAIKVKTDFLPSATAGASGGLFIAGSNAATSITTALTANVIGNITGNLSGSVGSATLVNGLAANVITAAATAADFTTEIQTGLATSTALADVANQVTDVQSIVGAIAVTGAATYKAAGSYTLTTGVLSSGLYTDTAGASGVYHVHTDDAGAIEVMYEFALGATEIGVEVLFKGRVNGINDSILVQAYDWVGLTWDTLWTQAGVAATVETNRAEAILARHTGTGGNDGLVRVRFYAASGLSTATLYVDQLLVAQATTHVDLTSTAIAAVADQVWDELQTDHVAAGSFGEVATEVASILVDTAEIGAAGAGLTALATQVSVDTVDTVVDAVKAKTDQLTFTSANKIDANILHVNSQTIGATKPYNTAT